MPTTRYLIQTRAARDYICPACGATIHRGEQHFRHDPYPYARIFRGEPTTHWCFACVMATGAEPQQVTHRRRVSSLVLPVRCQDQRRVELVTFTPALLAALVADPGLVFRISPSAFEDLLCDRLFAMGYEPRKVGATNRKDGGIDIFFWPRARSAFPILGAVQAKHHQTPDRRVGPGTVRDFAAAINALPINAGLIVTNTSFTPDAEWFAKERAALVRLRDFVDLRRWLANRFDDPGEWRDMPDEIQLCPGVKIDLNR